MYCGIGQKEDSEFPIQKSGPVGDHVCITIREKTLDKLIPRYAGKYVADCSVFPNYKFVTVEDAITAYLTSILAYMDDM